MNDTKDQGGANDSKKDAVASKPADDKASKAKGTNTPAASSSAPAKKGKGFVGFIAFSALIIAVGGFGAGYTVMQKNAAHQQEMELRLAASETALKAVQGAASQSDIDNLQAELAALGGRIDTTAGQVPPLQTQLEGITTQINELNTHLGDNNKKDWLTAEAQYLLNIAGYQAQINRNAPAAIAALTAADARLKGTGDPSLLKVRQAIADDIIALRGAAEVDTTQIALTLSQLEQRVAQLPLAHDEATPAAEDATSSSASAGDGFFDKLWHDLQGLIKIRRVDGDTGTAVLPPGQRFFLEQNLRLKLAAARLALMQGDTASYQDSLKTAMQWLERYFDTQASATANVLNSLSPIAEIDIAPALPDISTSSNAFEAWREAKREGGAS